MKLYLRFAICYFFVAIAVILLTRDNPMMIGEKIITSSRVFVSIFSRSLWVVALGVPVLALIVGPRRLMARMPLVLTALVASVLLQSSFFLIKTSMPYMVDFWADPLFARLDAALHLGRDPWVLAHGLTDWLPQLGAWAPFTYILAWTPFAFALPVIMVAIDSDRARVKRFLILHTFAWIVIGNLLALGFMSAGPVYYDRLLGGTRFSELTAALQASGISGGPIGRVQDGLWEVFVTNGQAVGSGISAFPSVHVSTATVAALYLYERARWLAPVAVAYVAAILFYSVFTGYHYALDGYVSIAVMVGLWVWLRRPARVPDRSTAMVPAE